jgi:hypothetical protein
LSSYGRSSGGAEQLFFVDVISLPEAGGSNQDTTKGQSAMRAGYYKIRLY